MHTDLKINWLVQYKHIIPSLYLLSFSKARIGDIHRVLKVPNGLKLVIGLYIAATQTNKGTLDGFFDYDIPDGYARLYHPLNQILLLMSSKYFMETTTL